MLGIFCPASASRAMVMEMVSGVSAFARFTDIKSNLLRYSIHFHTRALGLQGLWQTNRMLP